MYDVSYIPLCVQEHSFFRQFAKTSFSIRASCFCRADCYFILWTTERTMYAWDNSYTLQFQGQMNVFWYYLVFVWMKHMALHRKIDGWNARMPSRMQFGFGALWNSFCFPFFLFTKFNGFKWFWWNESHNKMMEREQFNEFHVYNENKIKCFVRYRIAFPDTQKIRSRERAIEIHFSHHRQWMRVCMYVYAHSFFQQFWAHSFEAEKWSLTSLILSGKNLWNEEKTKNKNTRQQHRRERANEWKRKNRMSNVTEHTIIRADVSSECTKTWTMKWNQRERSIQVTMWNVRSWAKLSSYWKADRHGSEEEKCWRKVNEEQISNEQRWHSKNITNDQ